jgi:hypothetical protein
MAEGNTLLMCDGSDQQWRIHATIKGENDFSQVWP